MNNYDAHVIDEAVKAFAKHETIYTIGLSCIDVLDFREPDSCVYALRVVFDHQRGNRVYISGDLGEAVVYPTCPATLEDMAYCFSSRKDDGSISVNWGYFLEKLRATSDRWQWTPERFWEDFKEHCKEADIDADDFIEDYENAYRDSNVEIDARLGVTLSKTAQFELREIAPDYSEWIYDCGKRVSPRVILWLVALRLAFEAVEKERGAHVEQQADNSKED
jgi:hypothetical protein